MKIIKVSLARLSLEIGEEKSIVFVCSTKHLRKLFVVWWKFCALAMITGYFTIRASMFSVFTVYFRIHEILHPMPKQPARWMWMEKNETSMIRKVDIWTVCCWADEWRGSEWHGIFSARHEKQQQMFTWRLTYNDNFFIWNEIWLNFWTFLKRLWTQAFYQANKLNWKC